MYSGGGYTSALMISDLEGPSFPWSSCSKKNVYRAARLFQALLKSPLPGKRYLLSRYGYRGRGRGEGNGNLSEMAAAGLWDTHSQLILWAGNSAEIYQSKRMALLNPAVNVKCLRGNEDFTELGTGVSSFNWLQACRRRLSSPIFWLRWKDSPLCKCDHGIRDMDVLCKENLLSIVRIWLCSGISIEEVRRIEEEERRFYAGIYRIPDLEEVMK